MRTGSAFDLRVQGGSGLSICCERHAVRVGSGLALGVSCGCCTRSDRTGESDRQWTLLSHHLGRFLGTFVCERRQWLLGVSIRVFLRKGGLTRCRFAVEGARRGQNVPGSRSASTEHAHGVVSQKNRSGEALLSLQRPSPCGPTRDMIVV